MRWRRVGRETVQGSVDRRRRERFETAATVVAMAAGMVVGAGGLRFLPEMEVGGAHTGRCRRGTGEGDRGGEGRAGGGVGRGRERSCNGSD